MRMAQKNWRDHTKTVKRTGEWSYWYNNGKLWSRGHYKDGVDHGLKSVYHENGQKYYEGNLKRWQTNWYLDILGKRWDFDKRNRL